MKSHAATQVPTFLSLPTATEALPGSLWHVRSARLSVSPLQKGRCRSTDPPLPVPLSASSSVWAHLDTAMPLLRFPLHAYSCTSRVLACNTANHHLMREPSISSARSLGSTSSCIFFCRCCFCPLSCRGSLRFFGLFARGVSVFAGRAELAQALAPFCFPPSFFLPRAPLFLPSDTHTHLTTLLSSTCSVHSSKWSQREVATWRVWSESESATIGDISNG